MTREEAYAIASQWGSFMKLSDPGAIFYTFPDDDARPATEEQREAAMNYTFDLIKQVRGDTPEEDLDQETASDVADLRALWVFFSETELRPEAA